MIDLGSLPGHPESAAVGINSRGQVIVRGDSGEWDDACEGAQGFLWESNRVITFPAGGPGWVSTPVSINDRGQVLVNSYDPSDGCAVHAFVWENRQMRALGTLGGTDSEGLQINNRGQVIGHFGLAGEALPVRGFLWEHGQMTDLSDFSASRSILAGSPTAA
jgi:probable HAF family extracellular repeat protein